MKRCIILFIFAILGIALTQLFGGIFFDKIPTNFQTAFVLSAISLKLLFYFLTIYTLVSLYKMPLTKGLNLFKVINWITTVLLTVFVIAYVAAIIFTGVRNHRFYNTKNLNEIPSTAIEAIVNPLVDYTGLPKEFIIALRLGNLDSNFAKLANYEPRKEVWEEVNSSNGWLSLNRSVCFDNTTDCARKLKGLSALSRQINNPMILVSPVMIATYNLKENFPVCSDKGLKLVPNKVYLDLIQSKIIAVYPGTETLTKCKYLQLSGFNARDFGYDWGKVSDMQNIFFPYPDNISKQIYQFKDSIISGNCCKNTEKKCNILSPIDDKVIFNVTSFPANIEIKLWKHKPFSQYKSADFKMEIRFVE